MFDVRIGNNQMNPKVSVIVPIYKVENYLQQCIDSICKQTYSFLEIILVDDGTPDRCGIICDENLMADNRIFVIHKENGGLSSARNAGLDIATGEYIAFVDADDTVHPKFIEVLVSLCEQYNCDIAQCDFLTIDEQSLKLPLNLPQSLIFYNGRQALNEMCTEKNDVKYSVVWNKVYKRELFCDIRFPLGRIHEDEFISYKIIWKAEKIVITNQYMYYYLQRSGSIMKEKYSKKRLDVLIAFKERLAFLKTNKLEEEYISTLRKYIGLIDKNYLLLKENLKDCEYICDVLLKERESLIKQLPLIPIKEELFYSKWTIDSCPFSQNAKLILYGAGKWGQFYYQWISDNHWGNVIGWVDNLWNGIPQTNYPVEPLDLIVRLTFDYILVAIKSKSVQKEVIQNLKCWGVAKEKIFTI